MKTHFDIKIFGRVQGVSFRVFIKKCADKLSIKGFVQNKSDNSVYIESEGEEKNLEKFIDNCKIGPSFAKVDNIETEEGEIKKYSNFEIKY